jgi:hypothetical protein
MGDLKENVFTFMVINEKYIGKIYRTKYIGQSISDKIYRTKYIGQNISDKIYRTNFLEKLTHYTSGSCSFPLITPFM